jgi:hypothetical protein
MGGVKAETSRRTKGHKAKIPGIAGDLKRDAMIGAVVTAGR